MNCEKCGAPLPAMAHFCPACGEALDPAETPEKINEVTGENPDTVPETEELPDEEIKNEAPGEEDGSVLPEKDAQDGPAASSEEKAENDLPADGLSDGTEEPQKEPTEEEIPSDEKSDAPVPAPEAAEEEKKTEPTPEADEERLLHYRRFLAYRGEITAAAGSGAVLTIAVAALLGVIVDILSSVVMVILNGQQNVGKGTFSVTVNILPIVLAVAFLILWGAARGREARLHTGALKTLRVLSVIRIIGLALALLCFVGTEASMAVLMIVGVPVKIPNLIVIPTALIFVFVAVLAGSAVLALINEIKLLRLWKDGIIIRQGGVARPKVGYIIFFYWMAAVISVLMALTTLMLIPSGNFVVAFVENMGYHVEASTAEMTGKLTPVIFGFTAIRWLIKACGKAAAARAAEKVKRAVASYRP